MATSGMLLDLRPQRLEAIFWDSPRTASDLQQIDMVNMVLHGFLLVVFIVGIFTKLYLPKHLSVGDLVPFALAAQLLAGRLLVIKRFPRFYRRHRTFIVVVVRLVRVACASWGVGMISQLPHMG